MNEKTVKKAAEVEAFLRLSGEITERATANQAAVDADVLRSLETLGHKSVTKSIPNEHQELFSDKTDKTSVKLRTMMELYIGDEWDNATEVLEWCSFFLGAASAHCAVAGGLAIRDGLPEVEALLHPLQDTYRKLLDDVIDLLANPK